MAAWIAQESATVDRVRAYSNGYESRPEVL